MNLNDTQTYKTSEGKALPYLVLNTDTDLLTLQYVDWRLFSFVKKESDPDNPLDYFMNGTTYTEIQNSIDEEYARQNFLKEQIQKNNPSGVIVSAPRFNGNFYYDEWDALNYVKFEIHSDFSDDLNHIKLVWYLRPLILHALRSINQTFCQQINLEKEYSKEELFEASLQGWITCYQRVISIHNKFVQNMNIDVDNTPYYNTKILW